MDLVKDRRAAYYLGFFLRESRGDSEVDSERAVYRVNIEGVSLDLPTLFADDFAVQTVIRVGAGEFLRLLGLSAGGYFAQAST